MRREAMLGRDQRVAGYTFMLRRAADEQHDETLPDVKRLYDETLLGNLQRMDIARLLGQRLAFVPLAPASLNHPLIESWPAAGTVWLLNLDARTAIDAALLARVEELKSRGFSFAVQADAVMRPECHALLQLADHVLMDVSSEDIPAITSQIAAVSKVAANKRFVATGVQTLEAFHMCHKLQMALFMGPFITRRENLGTPAMGPSRAKVLDLMNRVRTGAEQPELAAQFRHDPALSVRLLRYVNSPGMGLMNKIGGIEQALMVMGQDKLYRWLTLILFTGGQAQELDSAVLENALVRGRVAEQLAGRALFAKARDEIFVAGLFSLLDVVMHMPMEAILKQISLPAEITEAIVSQRGPYAPYLALAIACEQDDQSSIEALAKQIGRDVADINGVHMDALLWAQELSADV
ncbi:MAG: HDOD domain-containing protein [Gammaproteobacteria bacterium]|jgi:EAL and modified HD-GYP domain-containing signal transduction protein|nr:HDOD domain-containing protein [Gammaproteobacteria bacterium]MBU1409521.1 HDOD domain-containing protein [Gammaproteobacteria bacterium]MBU1530703.1 HDOD domain-containing protein [Gammaproteobacteria bacterium]